MTWFPQKQARAADAKDARVEWHCPTSARTWQLMLMMLWSVGPAVDHVQEAAQLMLGSVARLLIMRNEWLMLMMRGSGCPAADHVQEAVQLMLMMMRGSGGAAPHHVQEAT